MPKVIIHNSVSLDSAITGFDVDMGTHYEILNSYKPQAMLVGSVTAKTGVELFMDHVPPETEHDFHKHEVLKNDKRPYIVIIDSKGLLKGLLHVYRHSGYFKDVIVIVTSSTKKSYVEYLKKRKYDVIKSGTKELNLKSALNTLQKKYNIKTIVTDSGGKLNVGLLEAGLADEISLLIHPNLAGKKEKFLFQDLKPHVDIVPLSCQMVDRKFLHVKYKVLR